MSPGCLQASPQEVSGAASRTNQGLLTRKLLVVLGVPVDDLNMDEALDRLESYVHEGRATGKSHQIATVNADFVVNALHDPELRYILQGADMATADGMPLVLGARLLGVPLRGRVTGADMVPALAERAARQGFSLYLLGAKPGVAAQAARVLQQRYPGLNIVGVMSPPQASVLEMDQAVIDDLKAKRPDVLLVAFGNPKQEKWIHTYAKTLAIPVCIGVGGTLDMIAGVSRRAPQWMQSAGLEWLYRLLQEPRRLWKRYVRDLIYFGVFFLRQWWVMRGTPDLAAAPEPPSVALEEQAAVVRVRGRLDIGNVSTFLAHAEHTLASNRLVIIDLAEATFLDSSALGAFVALANRARDIGGTLRLAAVPPPIAHVLELVRLDRFFEIYDDIPSAQAPAQAPEVLPQDHAGWGVVKMPRILDATIVPGVVERCTSQLEGNPRLVLDFSETVFLSSAGLAAMAQLNRSSKERGGELRVAACSRDVLYGIRLVQLDAVVPLYRDVSAAVCVREDVS
jgi:N-acetylglucosaminyldiphosphoundecaprenol N-acetyl-beta-D-mannosaminyltransferase